MLISHPEEKNAPEKPLEQHLFNVGESSRQRIQTMILDLSVLDKEKLAELSFLIGIFHDFGKSTAFFQSYIRGERKGDAKTHHSFLSAVVAYHLIQEKGFDPAWAIAAYLIIKRHHGNLETLNHEEADNLDIAKVQLENILGSQADAVSAMYRELFGPDIRQSLEDIEIEAFSETLEEFEDDLDEFWEELEPDQQIEFFFVVNLLFSLLVDHDKKDAARLDMGYFEGNLDEPVHDVFAYIRDCQTQEPEKFNPELPLNQIRNRFLNEIASNPGISPKQHFYTISAPTGIGKTFGCLAFANQLKRQLPQGQGRIIYCLPYTSIIDQNHAEFERIIRFSKKEKYGQRPQRYLLKHHHLTFKALKNRKEEEQYAFKDYLDDRLFVEAWESAFVVTTFVQFFHTIIGHTNRFLKKFHNILNSIVILDEVQNIPPAYHHLLKRVLHVLGQRFNVYFLLITATQPEILDRKKSAPLALVQSDTYMKDPLFNRVKLSVEKTPCTLSDFADRFCQSFSGQNCLIVMNTKKSAIALYQRILEDKSDYEVFCLTTFLVPRDRKEKIKRIKAALEASQKIIVVSTQLIEAGVDLSFQRVYRDFGPLDSVVQVAGRCNRNNEYGPLGGEMHLVELLNEDQGEKAFYSYVYAPILANYTRSVMASHGYESRDFSDLAGGYFGKFEFKDKANRFLAAISELNYDQNERDQIPIKDFKLIEEYSQETLYILTTPEADRDMNRFLEIKRALQDKTLSKSEKESLLFEAEILKGRLKGFQIALRFDELEAYQEGLIVEDAAHFKYISYESQRKYAYDPDIGFLIAPNTAIPQSLSF